MFEPNETVALLLAFCVLAFLLPQREALRRVPSVRLLLSAFAVLCLGLVFTVLEGLSSYDLFNTLEHASNNISILLLVIWAWRLPRKATGAGDDA